MIISPESIFIDTLKSILKIVRDDFNNNVDETKTILYRSFNTAGKLERYKFYEQLKKVIITKEDDPRKFDFHLGFNMTKIATPHCHITLPSETSSQNGLGLDQGKEDPVFDDLTKTYRDVYTRRFDSTYNFTITSDNMNETIALYHWLRSVLIQLINHLELSNLEHIRISGGDIQLNPALVPPNIAIRNISVSFSYDLSVQDLFDTEFLTKLIFHQEPTVIPDSQVDQSDSFSY